jgi:hypothetical protein
MSTAKAVLDGTKMTNEQLGELTRRFDEIKKRINQGTLEYQWVIAEEQRLVEQGPPILIFADAVSIAPTGLPFLACNHFVEDISEGARVKISFVKAFGPEYLNKIEEPLLRGSRLLYGHPSEEAFPGQIIMGLGGLAKAETTLTEMFALMKAQRNAEKGPLLVDGNSNIFYVKNSFKRIHRISLAWINDGWAIFVNSVNENALGSHTQIFFRDPHWSGAD